VTFQAVTFQGGRALVRSGIKNKKYRINAYQRRSGGIAGIAMATAATDSRA